MNETGFDATTILSMIVVAGILIGGLWLSTLYIDFGDQLSGGTANTTGSIDIDEDVFDDMQEEMENFADNSFDGFDFVEMTNVILMPILAFVIIGISAIVVVYFTKR